MTGLNGKDSQEAINRNDIKMEIIIECCWN